MDNPNTPLQIHTMVIKEWLVVPRRWICLILLTVAGTLAFTAGTTVGAETKDVASVVQAILTAYRGQNAEKEIKQLGKALIASPQSATAVLDALAAENSVEAASVSAELLLEIAPEIGGRRLTDDPLWRQFGQKSTALLEHDDPFVRAMATWALIAVRDANQGPSQSEAPDWIAKCLALSPETSLECDFVLQAIGLGGAHRTPGELVRSAGELADRADDLAAYAVTCGGEAQRNRVNAARESAPAGARSSRGAEGSRPILRARRKWWIDVRRAVRRCGVGRSRYEFRRRSCSSRYPYGPKGIIPTAWFRIMGDRRSGNRGAMFSFSRAWGRRIRCVP